MSKKWLTVLLLVHLFGRAARGQDKDQALVDAAKGNDVAAVRQLLAGGANANARGEFGYTAMHWAAGSGNVQIIGELVAAGADVSAKSEFGWTPLMLAARDARVDAVLALLDAGTETEPNEKLNSGWICGRVLGEDPAAGAYVEILLVPEFPLGAPAPEPEARTVANAQGEFCLTQLRPGGLFGRKPFNRRLQILTAEVLC